MDVGSLTPYLPQIVDAVIQHLPTLTSSQALLIGGVGAAITVVAYSFPEVRSLLKSLAKTLYDLLVAHGHWASGSSGKAFLKLVLVVLAMIEFIGQVITKVTKPTKAPQEVADTATTGVEDVVIEVKGKRFALVIVDGQTMLVPLNARNDNKVEADSDTA